MVNRLVLDTPSRFAHEPVIGMTLTQAIGALKWKWRLIGSAAYQFLPDELADSPLLERVTAASTA